MSVLRRYFKPNQICFITSVTYQRKPILVESADIFWLAVERTQAELPFGLVAWVLLPDHCHLLLTSERGDFSEIVKRMKLSFAALYRRQIQADCGTVWQARFWDHIIRGERDLGRHADYIHYNPVKHGLAENILSWPHSSASKYYSDQVMPSFEGITGCQDGEFGE